MAVKRYGPWLAGALLMALVLAAWVGPYASSRPDGLERVAADQNFLDKSANRPPVWRHAPAADYAIPGLLSHKKATGLAGLAGTLLVFGAGLGLARLLAPAPAGRAATPDEGDKRP